ncbi:MAG: insulinase family protein [Candidatus Synoicihabitans palmerolidicus]|nr:insulinase family protein [Candidatus Synoicihabitans palmerolidicus]
MSIDYYDTWYRPERMTIVAVGDFDIDRVERQIQDAFSSLTARDPARNDPPTDVILPGEGERILYHHEPEAGNVTVGIQTVQPYTHEDDTAANRVKNLPRDLAFAMLNRRLSELAKQEGAPFSSGFSNAGSFYEIADNTTIELRSDPDKWPSALTVAENELRRALEFGFQAPELNEVIAGMRNGLDQAVRRASTRRSSGLAMGILSSIADENVFTTPETNFELMMPALDEVTIEACDAAFRAAWDTPHRPHYRDR